MAASLGTFQDTYALLGSAGEIPLCSTEKGEEPFKAIDDAIL